MQRTVVVRHLAQYATNVNDEIGLEPYACYTIGEYLEDRASEGVTVLAHHGGVYAFSDGTTEVLEQKMERIRVEQLDEATRDMVVSAAAMRQMPHWRGDALMVAC